MNYRLEHIAIWCKDLDKAAQFYCNLFKGEATETRKGSAGYRFCFVKIDGATPIQLMESKDKEGVHHYGFVTDNVEQAMKSYGEKGAVILRENRDQAGKLTTVFLRDPNGMEIEIRVPR
jgi:catechol 2,3-dioxygenase-like lactoylglutathione lyase family enzyme